MSSALPLAMPSASGMSNRTMSPNSFWPASSASVPPICPAPISAIFLRAMRKTPVREAARGSAISEKRQDEWKTGTIQIQGLRSPKYWRERAEEARALGDDIRDATVKTTMKRVARMYDRLAAAQREGIAKLPP